MKIKSVGVSLAISLLALAGAPSHAQTTSQVLEDTARVILNARAGVDVSAPASVFNPLVLHEHGDGVAHQHRYSHSASQEANVRFATSNQNSQYHQHGSTSHQHAGTESHSHDDDDNHSHAKKDKKHKKSKGNQSHRSGHPKHQ